MMNRTKTIFLIAIIYLFHFSLQAQTDFKTINSILKDYLNSENREIPEKKKEILNRFSIELIDRFDHFGIEFQDILLSHYKDADLSSTSRLYVIYDQESAIALVKSPAQSTGKIFLTINNGDTFVYFPKPRRYIRINPRQKLFGNATVGDIIKPPLKINYKFDHIVPKIINQTDVPKKILLELWFKAKKNRKPAYFFKNIHLDPERKLLVKLKNISKKKNLVSTVEYLEFKEVEKQTRPSKIKISGSIGNSYTIVESEKIFLLKNLKNKASLFHPTTLKHAGSRIERISQNQREAN